MFSLDYYKSYDVPNGGEFGCWRDTYNHSGIDYSGTKQNEVREVIDGALYDVKKDKNFGLLVTTKHNPKYVDGVKELFYVDYCHMHDVSDDILKANDDLDADRIASYFVKHGTVLGHMGNSGHCMTYDDQLKDWRDITEEERNDVNFNRGVHTHLSIYQWCKNREKTQMFQDMVKLGVIDEKNINEDYFWQWNKLYYNPERVYEYFALLQK